MPGHWVVTATTNRDRIFRVRVFRAENDLLTECDHNCPPQSRLNECVACVDRVNLFERSHPPTATGHDDLEWNMRGIATATSTNIYLRLWNTIALDIKIIEISVYLVPVQGVNTLCRAGRGDCDCCKFPQACSTALCILHTPQPHPQWPKCVLSRPCLSLLLSTVEHFRVLGHWGPSNPAMCFACGPRLRKTRPARGGHADGLWRQPQQDRTCHRAPQISMKIRRKKYAHRLE